MIPLHLNEDDDYDSSPINDNDNPFLSEEEIVARWRNRKGFEVDQYVSELDEDNPFK